MEQLLAEVRVVDTVRRATGFVAIICVVTSEALNNMAGNEILATKVATSLEQLCWYHQRLASRPLRYLGERKYSFCIAVVIQVEHLIDQVLLPVVVDGHLLQHFGVFNEIFLLQLQHDILQVHEQRIEGISCV